VNSPGQSQYLILFLFCFASSVALPFNDTTTFIVCFSTDRSATTKHWDIVTNLFNDFMGKARKSAFYGFGSRMVAISLFDLTTLDLVFFFFFFFSCSWIGRYHLLMLMFDDIWFRLRCCAAQWAFSSAFCTLLLSTNILRCKLSQRWFIPPISVSSLRYHRFRI